MLWICTLRPAASQRLPECSTSSSPQSFPGSEKVRQAQELIDIERRRRHQPPDLPVSVRKIGRIGQQQPVRVISFDEMWTYVGVRRGQERRSVWVWTAVVEEQDGRRWSDFEVGGRDYETFIRLYRRLPAAERCRSDLYRVYGWLPSERHVVGRGSEVNRNEGLHSMLRGKLNRLVRRTKGYTKSVQMLAGSLSLVWIRERLI